MLLNGLRRFWRQLFVVAVALVFLPLPLIIATKAAHCAYVLALMSVFWLAEVLPMPIVAILPAILLPTLGVQSSKNVCRNYFKDSAMLFMGSLSVAVAVEESHLHQRIALRVLLLVGSHPRWLMLGFMCISGFLSMWISNTAATAMITPIAETVMMELFKRQRAADQLRAPRIFSRSPSSHNRGGTILCVGIQLPAISPSTNIVMELCKPADNASASVAASGGTVPAKIHQQETGSFSRLDLDAEELRCMRGMILCVAYAANIGGTATLTGTMPNIVLKGQIDALYGPVTGVNFATFLLFSLPGMLLTLIVAFIWLQWIFISTWSCRKRGKNTAPVKSREALRAGMLQERSTVRQIIQAKYNDLGTIGFGEASVMLLFLFLVTAWILRDPYFIAGWQAWFPRGYVSDATPAILVSFLLFIWPRKLSPANDSKGHASLPPILTWAAMKRRFPWDVFLLLGGAIALADATQVSGLADWMKDQMHYLTQSIVTSYPTQFSQNLGGMVIVIVLLVSTLTEFASNGTIATIFLPILAKLAEVSHVNPLYLMLPATMACSFAFMLPVATPPNAIAFGSGFLRIRDMVVAGFGLSLLAIVILLVNLHTTGVGLFQLLQTPAWLIALPLGLPINTTGAVANNITTLAY
ncbi:solute carrier family 13 member 2-like [Paramacrobiotus metropolitanus]|uniref:solute carrier family 13 member 2-like n=1 Tax=Paramacrobiotus metropolitanus TaxID=2943436 RepID=UPI002445C881|nr:solute carrier family 13 member 2-like [Paramacrobiotus metropolitanus]